MGQTQRGKLVGVSNRSRPTDQPGQDIREFFRRALAVRDRVKKNRLTIASAARATADERQISFDDLRKAAQSAEEFREGQVEKICQFCLTPGCRPVSVNHDRRALKLKSRMEKMRWLRRAAERGWSAERLAQAIRPSDGVQSAKGGPSLKKPEDLREAIESVRQLSDN